MIWRGEVNIFAPIRAKCLMQLQPFLRVSVSPRLSVESGIDKTGIDNHRAIFKHGDAEKNDEFMAVCPMSVAPALWLCDQPDVPSTAS